MKLIDKFKLVSKFPINILNSLRYKKPRVLSDTETLEYIIHHNCSISRYGDGEMNIMLGHGILFQKFNKTLQQRLFQIAICDTCSHMVCIPNVFHGTTYLKAQFVKKSFQFWKKNLTFTTGYWYKYFRGKQYGDAFISRFYMEKNNKKRDNYVKLLKSVFYNRNILFVEGAKSRLGVGNDLFGSDITKFKRIICPTTNAFEKYNEILDSVFRFAKKTDLIIVALGPTATVLCYDLSMAGYQALDLGHIDVEYEWFMSQAQEKVPVLNKDMSEVKGQLIDNDILKANNYTKQILTIIHGDNDE